MKKLIFFAALLTGIFTVHAQVVVVRKPVATVARPVVVPAVVARPVVVERPVVAAAVVERPVVAPVVVVRPAIVRRRRVVVVRP